jgi:PIN domain nuclease of toxin-antitoxin system
LKTAAVADTHAALWYVLKNPLLSNRARSFIEDAAGAGVSIAVSAISLAEIVYLVEKKRLPESAYDDLRAVLDDRTRVLKEIQVSAEIVEAMRRVPREVVPDMPDRIIAATGVFLGVPVISRDGKIRASTVETIW